MKTDLNWQKLYTDAKKGNDASRYELMTNVDTLCELLWKQGEKELDLKLEMIEMRAKLKSLEERLTNG